MKGGSPHTPLRRPKTGPRRTLQAAIEGRKLPACRGATPFWDRRRAPFGGQD